MGLGECHIFFEKRVSCLMVVGRMRDGRGGGYFNNGNATVIMDFKI
jgi:hypothetical protein